MEDILTIVFLFGGGIVIALGFSPIGKAVAERIRGRAPAAGDSPQLDGVLDEVQQLRHEVAELAERVDFVERLQAKPREPERLPRGSR